MTDMLCRSIQEIENYHAHIYFDGVTEREHMLWLRDQLAQRFSVQLVDPIEQPVGMHPRPMLVVAFMPDQFSRLVPWLMLNRQELSVLIHPNTDNPLADHVSQAAWLGTPLLFPPNDQLPEGWRQPTSLKALGRAQPAVLVNTQPLASAVI